MQKLTDHYQQLLGFPAVWKVDDVKLPDKNPLLLWEAGNATLDGEVK